MENLSKNLTDIFSSKRHYYALIIITAIGLCLLFLWGTPQAYPMGDSYIHFAYARNLIQHGELAYNPGLDEGIGSSSFLWVLILGFFQLFGISPVIMAKILGVAFLIFSSILIFELALQFLVDQANPGRFWKSTLLALVAMLSGSMMWNALSGMETLLFLLLGLFCLWLYARGSWILLGICLGLLALTRIEGISLAGIILLVEFVRARRINATILKVLTPFLLVLTPWLVYLQIREGAPVSTSFQGRQFVVSAVDDMITQQFPAFSWLAKINPLVFFACWVYFTLIYISGSASLPGAAFRLGGNLVGTDLTLPAAGIVVGILCLPLLYFALRQYLRLVKPVSLKEPRKRLLTVMVGWYLALNLAYALFLPRVGAAGRYIPLNHSLFWISLLVGSSLIRRKWLKTAAYVFVIVLFGISINYWRSVYRANVDYLVEVRKPAAQFIDQRYPLDEFVGATDLGAIGYYSKQPVVDLLGHVNQGVLEHLAGGGDMPGYIAEKQLCYLMLFASSDNSGIDVGKAMGLFEDERFDLIVEGSFSVPTDEWSVGNGPIRNYMPVVNVYRVDWHDRTICAQSAFD